MNRFRHKMFLKFLNNRVYNTKKAHLLAKYYTEAIMLLRPKAKVFDLYCTKYGQEGFPQWINACKVGDIEVETLFKKMMLNQYRRHIESSREECFRPLEVLKDKEQELKRKYPINLFVKKFHMADVLNIQCNCEDLLNPYLDVIRKWSSTKSTKKAITKKARAKYEVYKKVVENRLKQYSIAYVINLYLDYKFVDVEAYNAFFVKIRDPFMMSMYNLAKETIHKRFSECNEVIKRCEKEFLK